MGDPADVRLVDAHPESHGRHDDQPVLALEACFDKAAVFGLHAPMVEAGRMIRLVQGTGDPLGLGTGSAVDDTRLAPPSGGKGQDLSARPTERTPRPW